MIELEQRGEISILRMVRGKGNALSLDFLQALMDAFEQIDHSPTRAAIITGQGNVFSRVSTCPHWPREVPATLVSFCRR